MGDRLRFKVLLRQITDNKVKATFLCVQSRDHRVPLISHLHTHTNVFYSNYIFFSEVTVGNFKIRSLIIDFAFFFFLTGYHYIELTGLTMQTRVGLNSTRSFFYFLQSVWIKDIYQNNQSWVDKKVREESVNVGRIEDRDEYIICNSQRLNKILFLKYSYIYLKFLKLSQSKIIRNGILKTSCLEIN